MQVFLYLWVVELEAGFLGDVLVLMQDGRIVQQGSLADLVQRPAGPFVTRFVNSQRAGFHLP